ncbi:hypothetical protein [Exiguobacterium chiriqhucha]|uniref:hypothetical protein n=1 Tax=Exiguobacterium chiriqhucha TaxID=1385984 RepID=UPI0038B909AC
MKNLKKFVGVLLLTMMMMMPIMANAATKYFTFQIKHQLSIGSFTSTKNSVTGTVTMSKWGTDTSFDIKIYKKNWGSVDYIGKMTFTKSSAGSPYKSTNYNVKSGTTYGYEIWKTQNNNEIVGSGSLSY